jgi:hypothetical protein
MATLVTFPSKEVMMKNFKENEHLNYFVEKGVMASICDHVAGQKKFVIGVNLAIELAFADHTDVFEDTTPVALALYKETVKDAVLNCAV